MSALILLLTILAMLGILLVWSCQTYEPSFRWEYYFLHPLAYAQSILYNLRALEQRGRRGFANRDLWNLSVYLSGWLPAALRLLRERGLGLPHAILPELPQGRVEWTQEEMA